jgi:hypothetical protein
MVQERENNVVDAEFTEVVEETPVVEVEAVEAATEETAEQVAPEQAAPQPVVLLGKVRMSRESVLLGSTIISHTLNLLSETGASAKFESMDQYLGYIKTKVTDVLYTIFPAGAVVEVTAIHDEEKDQINVGLKMNTETDLEVYSDRVQVVSFVKVR